MAEQKEKGTPFFTTDKVKLYAPKGAKFHGHGQEVEVQVRQKDKFLKLGYTESAEEAKDAEAHPAIAIPVAKAPRGKKPGGDENKGEGE
jgi:hypothetical protein